MSDKIIINSEFLSIYMDNMMDEQQMSRQHNFREEYVDFLPTTFIFNPFNIGTERPKIIKNTKTNVSGILRKNPGYIMVKKPNMITFERDPNYVPPTREQLEIRRTAIYEAQVDDIKL